jgi:HK97 family phage prohead protease
MWSWRALRRRFVARPAATFSGNPKPLAALLALAGGTATSVTRQQALSVPAVQRGRNLLASIATLPLVQLGPDGRPVDNPLLRQFDLDVPNVVHLAQTVEDLLLDGIAWWEITSQDFAGFPMTVRRLDPAAVSLEPPGGSRMPAPLPSGVDPRGAVVYVDGRPVAAPRVIRFDSPNPGVLQHCGRTIRRAIALERAAELYARDPRPADYFSPAEGVEELDDDDIADFLGQWAAARRDRATAYVPRWAQYNTVDAPTPQELQLVELQRQVWVEIAQLLGVDSEDLSVSTTSRTYFNAFDRRQSRINDVLAPYMKAVTDRLSMGDVTRRGHRVQFDLVDYLKADPASRIAYYEGLLRLGAITPEQIAAAEGLGPPPAGAAPEPEPAEAADRPATFDGPDITFADVELRTFAVNRESRTIEGLAVPYGRVASKDGAKFRFVKGSLRWTDPGRVKLLRDHDPRQPLGKAISLRDTSAGLQMKFRVARGPEGDRALELAEDGVLDGMSVGVDFREFGADPRDRAVNLVTRADLREVSLVAVPAFDDARVTRVAASAMEGTNMSEETATEPTVAPAEQAPAAVPAPAPETTAPATVTLAREERQLVNPLRPVAATMVADPAAYRFDRKGPLLPAAHDFGADIIQAAKAGMAQNFDNPAYRRVMEFMRHQFADDPIVNADVNELNPTINVARYIDEREFQYPLWSRLGRGAPPNGINPFQWPAFSSSGITIQDYSENTEPETDDYVTTGQSVTPVAKAAKASMPRTVFDMGGTPGLGDLIWRKMNRAWYEAAEAVIVAAFTAAAGSITSLATLTAGGGTGKATLAAELEAGLAALQFVRGGFRFDFAAAQADLYAALAAAVDTTGRKLYPMVNPTNANGGASSQFSALNVAGVPFQPEWALAAAGQTAATNSYLLDSTAADAWVSPPQRLDFSYEVNKVYIAAWGYMAAAVNDLAGTRKIVYDPVA